MMTVIMFMYTPYRSERKTLEQASVAMVTSDERDFWWLGSLGEIKELVFICNLTFSVSENLHTLKT